MTEIFLDASFAIALVSSADAHHTRAVAIAQKLDKERSRLVTTQAVVLEIGNALARRRHRPGAIALLTSIEKDPKIEIIPLSVDLLEKAFVLFKNRPDKDWGLTDCLSFIVMYERKLSDALTADVHFQQAGFRPLLLEPI